MEEQLRQLFDSLGGESRVGSFESFKSVMSDRENRVNLFNQIKGQYEGNFEEFETSIGFAQPNPEVNVQGNLEKLYEDLGGDERLGSIERFSDAMSESTNRYNLYRQIKDTEKGTFEEFSESLGYSSKEPQEEETEAVASFDTDILSPERAKERAQSYLDQGVAPIINDKGEVEFTEIEGGTLGELEQDKYGYYMPIKSFSKPGEWAVERWARGDQKIYLGPTEELSTVLNSLSEEDIKRGYESNGNFKQQFWNANAFELYNTLGVKTAEEYSFVANQNDNLFVGRKALQNISERQSKLVEEASLRMREIAPAETDLLDDLSAKADMIEGRLNSPDITESERLDLEADLGIIKNTFEEIVTKPIQTEEGVVTLAQLPEFSQQFQSAELVNSVNARFQELYKGSNQEQMDLLAERTLEEANDKLRKLYDKYGQVGYVAGQALNKGKTLWYGAMSTVAGLAGRLLREDYDLSDRDARQDVNWWNKTNVSGEDIALEGFTEAAMIYSTLAETAQGDRNTGGLRRNQYIINDSLTAVLDDDYNILSIEDNDGFNVMSDLSDEAVQAMQAEITRNKGAVEGDWSFWRGSSTAADVFLNLIPLFATTAGIRSGGRWVSKKMLEKKGLGKMSEALSGGLSIGAGVFVTTYPSYFISNLKEGVPVSKAEKLAIAQASVESILTPLVGPVESKALRALTQAERISMKNAASAYLSGKITIGGLAQKWGKIGKGLSVDVLKELSEETLVQAGTDTVSVLGGIDSKSSFNEYLDVWFSTIGVSSFLGGLSRVPEIRESPTSASAFTSQIKGWSKTITKNLLKDVDKTSTLIDEVGTAMGLSQEEINKKKAILFAAQQAQENLDPSIPQAVRDTYLSNVVEHHILDDNLNNVQDELLRNSFSIASERLKLTNKILADNSLRTAYETLLGDKISDYDSAKKGDFSLKDLLANIEDGVEISSGVKKRALDHLKKVYERIGDSEKEPDFSPGKRFALTTVLQMMHQFIDTYDHSTAEPTRKTTQDSPVPKTRIIHKDDALETPHEEGATISVNTSRRKENRKVELKTTKNGQESDGKRYRSLSDAVTELGETLTEDLEKYQGEEVILNSISDSPTQSVASFSIGTETVEIPLPNRHTSYLEQLKELEDNDSTKEDVKAPKANVSYYRKKLEEMGDQDYLVVEGDEAAKAKEAGLTITENGISKSEIKQKLFDMGESYKTPPSDTSTKKPTTPETEAPAEVEGTITEEDTSSSEPEAATEEPTPVEPFKLTYRGVTYTRDPEGQWTTPKGNTPSSQRITTLETEYQSQQAPETTTEEPVVETEEEITSEPETTTEETPPVEEPAPEPETTEPVEEPTDVEEDSEAPLTRPVDIPAPVEEPFSLTYRGINYTRNEQGEWLTPKGKTPSDQRVAALEEEYQKQQSEQVTTEEEFTEQEIPNREDRISTLFNENPDIANAVYEALGFTDPSPEQRQQAVQAYSNYISTLFPASEVDDILYHGTTDDKFFKYSPEEGEYVFQLSELNPNTHFGTIQSATDRIRTVRFNADSLEVERASDLVIPVRINAKSKEVEDQGDSNTDWNNEIDQAKEEGFNSLKYVNQKEDEGSTSYVVFSPSDVHILGSESDIAGFKEFVDNNAQTTPTESEEVFNDQAIDPKNISTLESGVQFLMSQGLTLEDAQSLIEDLGGEEGFLENLNSFINESEGLASLRSTGEPVWDQGLVDLYRLTQGDTMASVISRALIKKVSFKRVIDYLKGKGYDIEYTDAMREADKELNGRPPSYDHTDLAKARKEAAKKLGFKTDKEYLVTELEEAFPIKGPAAEIWKIIKPLAELLGLTASFDTNFLDEFTPGLFNPTTGWIKIDPLAKDIGGVLLEETIHALTAKVIDKVLTKKTDGLTDIQIQAVRDLQKMYDEVKNSKDFKGQYSVSNIYEFIGHLGDEEVRNNLIKRGIDFLQRIYDAILDILGIPANAYTYSKQILSDIVSNTRFFKEEGILAPGIKKNLHSHSPIIYRIPDTPYSIQDGLLHKGDKPSKLSTAKFDYQELIRRDIAHQKKSVSKNSSEFKTLEQIERSAGKFFKENPNLNTNKIDYDLSRNIGPEGSGGPHDYSSMSDLTDRSGGANGGDTEWELIGKKFGVKNFVHYWAGRKTPRGNRGLSKEELAEGVEKVRQTYRALVRPDIPEYYNLHGRNWFQVKNADAVYAVSIIQNPGEKGEARYPNSAGKQVVAGGTGYAVEMAIQHNKPVYVYHQSSSMENPQGWYKWSAKDMEFIPVDTPVLTRNFAGIGSRNINDAGRKAISDVYAATLNRVKGRSQPKPETPTEPTQQSTSFPDYSYSKLGTSVFLPENNHVTIDSDRARSLGKDKSGAIKAYRTRKKGFEEAFEKDRAIGNPFSVKGYHGTIATGSVETAVDAFFRWLEGTEYTNYQQPYRQMILDNLEDLRGREIVYYRDIGQPSHATALDYFLNSKQPTTPARSNKVTIEDGVEKTFQKKGDKWEKVNVVTSNEKTKQALDKAKKDVKIVPKSNQNVPGKMIATGREAMIANSATPIPSYELRSSGRQTIKTTYTTKADHKGFDLSIIDSVTAGEYEGDVNSETMLPEGYGKMIFPDGTYYEGMWYAGKPNGWGRKTTFKYNRVLNRRRSGKTEESEQREEVHTEGLFIQGKYIGNKAFDIVEDRKTTSKGYDILYSGTTNVLGKPHGWGIQKFYNKKGKLYAVYEGEFFNGKRSGKGAVTFLDDRPTEYQNSPLTLAKYNYDYLDSLNEYSRFKLEFKSGATEIKRVPKQVAARSKKTGKVYLKKGPDDLYILDTNTGVYDLIVDEEFETYVKRLTSPDFVSFGALEGEDKAEGYLTQSSDSGILRNHRVTWGTATPNKAGVNKSGVVVNTQRGEYFIVSPEQSKNSVFKLQGDSAPFAAQILAGKDPEIVLSEIVDLVLAEFPEKPGRGYEQRVQRLVDRIVEDYIPTDVRIDTVQGRKLVRELVVDIANRATSKQQLAVNHIKASKVGNNIYAVKMSGDVAMVLNDSEGNIISHYVGGGNPLTYSLSEGMPVLNTPKPRVLVVRVDKGQTLSILNNFANAESALNDFIATGNGKAMEFRDYLKQHKSTDAAFVSIDHEKPGEYRDYFPKDADRNYVIPPFYQTHYTITTRDKKGEEERPSRNVPVYFAPEINEFVTIEPSDGRRTRVPKSRLKEVHDNAQTELYEADRRMRSLDSENDIDQIRANIIEELANIPEEEEVPPSSKTSTKYSFQLQYNGQLYEHNRKGDWFRLEGDTKTKVSKLIYPILNRHKIAEGMTTGKRAMRVNTKSSKYISGRGVIVQDQGGHVSFSDGVFDRSSLEGSGYAAVMYNDGNIMIHEGTFENGVLYEGTQIDIFPNGQAFATTVEAPKDDGDMGERISEFKDYSTETEESTDVEEGSDELSQDDLDIENQEIAEDTEEIMSAVFSGDIQSTTPEKDIPDTGAIPLNNLDPSNAKKVRNLLHNFSKSLDKSINFTDWGRYEKFVADVKNRLSESLESLPVETKPSGKADANLLLGIFDVLSAKTSVKEFLSGRDIGIDDMTFYQEWRADRRSEKFERQDQAISEDEAIMQERQVELNNMFLDAMIGGNYDALNILIENFKNSGVPDVKLRLLKELPKLIDQNTVRENLEGALEKGNFFEMAMAGAFKSKCD